MADSYLSWINLVIIIVIIIALIIMAILFFNHQTFVEVFGISYTITEGTTTESSETISLAGNQIYIANSSMPVTLTLNKNSDQDQGRLVGIKNNSGSNVTLMAGTIKFDVGQLNNTVTVGQTAWLLSTDTTDGWLRLQ